MSHNLKKISFEELEKMKGDKRFYNGTISARSRQIMLSKMKERVFSKENIGQYTHLIFSSDSESYVDQLDIIKVGKCAIETNLSEFKQDMICLFKVGDPYLFIGTVKGVYSDNLSYLVIEISGGDIFLAWIDNQKVQSIEIVPEMKEFSFEEFKEMAKGKALSSTLDVSYIGARFVPGSDFSHEEIMRGGCHTIISSDFEEFKKRVEIVSGDCAKHTPLSNFIQNEKHLFKAGDPYTFYGTVTGILKDSRHLIIETEWGDFLLCEITWKDVRHLEIIG